MRCTTERDAWLALAHAAGVGPATAGALVRAVRGDVRAAVRDPLRAARSCGALSSAVAERTARAVLAADPGEVEAAASAAGCAVVTPVDAGYPASVRESADPPAALFVRGALPPDGVPACAVVGTRASTPYGSRVARDLAEGLARAGVVVVSGLARGVDAAAHEGTLAAGGTTVAVLGTGVDVVYPADHASLARAVVERGALVSEHLPGAPPRKHHFLRRNRIVAALARAVVVVEAPARSGALGTAGHARDLGRAVLAVPGPVDRRSAGCHGLLRQGAALCEGVADVLREMGLLERGLGGEGCGFVPRDGAAVPRDEGRAGARSAGTPCLPGATGVLLGALDVDDAADADDLAIRTGLSPDEVAAALTALELDGYARRIPGVGFLRAR